MNINDIFAKPTGIERPEHADYWRLSEIILDLKADMAETQDNPVEQERRWRAHYEEIGDFDSIAYCAIQAALQVHSIRTGADWQRLKESGGMESYIKSVQTYFDGFIMGAQFVRRGM